MDRESRAFLPGTTETSSSEQAETKLQRAAAWFKNTFDYFRVTGQSLDKQKERLELESDDSPEAAKKKRFRRLRDAVGRLAGRTELRTESIDLQAGSEVPEAAPTFVAASSSPLEQATPGGKELTPELRAEAGPEPSSIERAGKRAQTAPELSLPSPDIPGLARSEQTLPPAPELAQLLPLALEAPAASLAATPPAFERPAPAASPAEATRPSIDEGMVTVPLHAQTERRQYAPPRPNADRPAPAVRPPEQAPPLIIPPQAPHPALAEAPTVRSAVPSPEQSRKRPPYITPEFPPPLVARPETAPIAAPRMEAQRPAATGPESLRDILQSRAAEAPAPARQAERPVAVNGSPQALAERRAEALAFSERQPASTSPYELQREVEQLAKEGVAVEEKFERRHERDKIDATVAAATSGVTQVGMTPGEGVPAVYQNFMNPLIQPTPTPPPPPQISFRPRPNPVILYKRSAVSGFVTGLVIVAVLIIASLLG